MHQAADCVITHTEEVFCKIGTEARKELQERRQKPNGKADESDENKAQQKLSPDIVGVKNYSAFDDYRLSLNYTCGEVVCSDEVFVSPPPNCRKFVVKYAKAAPAEPGHRRLIHLRTGTVTVKEVMIDNQAFVCTACSCSSLQ